MQNIKKIFGASLTIEELNKAKVIMAILLFTVASSFPLSVFDSYVMACEKFTFLKVLNILKTLAIPLTMLPLLFLGYKSIAMVIINSLFTLLYHVGTLIYCKKKLKMKLSFSIKSFDKKLFKEISFYSVFIFLNIIVDNLFNNTDQVILGSICGTTAVSIYAIGSRISSMNVTFSTTISGLFLPRVTKMIEEKNSDKELSNLFIKVARIQIYLMVLILSGFIIYGKAFINLWVGNSYADAYWIILLLIGPALIPLTQNLGISIIQAKNKHQFRSVVYIIIAILNVIISIPLAKKYQGIGAAIGTAIANVIGQIITMNIFYWKKINIDIPKYWKNLIIFIIPVGVLSTLNIILIRNISFNWIKLVVAAILYLCAYFMIVFNYMNEEEKKYIRNIRQKFFYDRRKK